MLSTSLEQAKKGEGKSIDIAFDSIIEEIKWIFRLNSASNSQLESHLFAGIEPLIHMNRAIRFKNGWLVIFIANVYELNMFYILYVYLLFLCTLSLILTLPDSIVIELCTIQSIIASACKLPPKRVCKSAVLYWLTKIVEDLYYL
jgi:hypothetical protein